MLQCLSVCVSVFQCLSGGRSHSLCCSVCQSVLAAAVSDSPVCLCYRVCQLVGLTVCLLAVVATHHTLRARPPRLGFLAMRGKRNASRADDGGGGGGGGGASLVARRRRFTYPLHRLMRLNELYDDVYTRADRTFGFTGLRGKKAPAGFGGLRGKRISGGFGGLRGKRISGGFGGLRGKRIPGGFGGLRGKKIPGGFSGLRGKRIPNGFIGFRGKKTPNGFSGLRGKRPLAGSVRLGPPGSTSPERRMATRLLEISDLDALRHTEEQARTSGPPPQQAGQDWLTAEE